MNNEKERGKRAVRKAGQRADARPRFFRFTRIDSVRRVLGWRSALRDATCIKTVT